MFHQACVVGKLSSPSHRETENQPKNLQNAEYYYCCNHGKRNPKVSFHHTLPTAITCRPHQSFTPHPPPSLRPKYRRSLVRRMSKEAERIRVRWRMGSRRAAKKKKIWTAEPRQRMGGVVVGHTELTLSDTHAHAHTPHMLEDCTVLFYTKRIVLSTCIS